MSNVWNSTQPATNVPASPTSSIVNVGGAFGQSSTLQGLVAGDVLPIGWNIPADWGRRWFYSKRNAAWLGNGICSVYAFSDSIMNFYSSNWGPTANVNTLPTSSFGLIINALQAQNDGGSGVVSARDTTGIVAGSAGTVTASGAGGSATGGWNALVAGLNSYALFPNVAGSGVTLTWNNVRGNTIKFAYYPSVGASTTAISIDGVAVAGSPFNTQGAGTQIQVLTFNVTAGTHTVVTTATTGTPIHAAVGGFYTSGVVGHNFSFAGRTSGDISTASSLTNPGWATTGAVTLQQNAAGLGQPVDLLIYQCGLNDVSGAITALAYAKNVALAMDYAKASNANCDILLYSANRGSLADANELYPSYLREVLAVAQAYGAAHVNMWALGRNAYSYWQGLSYWGDGTNDGLPGADAIHLSNLGHAFTAQLLTPLVLAQA